MNSHRDLSLAAPHVVERFARDFLTDKCGVIRQNTRSGRDRILYYRKISGPDLASQVRLMRHVSHDNIVHVLRAMECEDSEHLLEISEYMSHVVVDLCVKSFAAFDELALAAILGQGISFRSDKWSEDSEAIEFWQALLQPNATMEDLMTREDIQDLAILAGCNTR
ncbi:hypothetical protein HC256_009992 [Beauveria bassiana]|nr:hypothetical protein HC256_009992 [Beauveria bassiana]